MGPLYFYKDLRPLRWRFKLFVGILDFHFTGNIVFTVLVFLRDSILNPGYPPPSCISSDAFHYERYPRHFCAHSVPGLVSTVLVTT